MVTGRSAALPVLARVAYLGGAVDAQPGLLVVVVVADECATAPALVSGGCRLTDLTESLDAHGSATVVGPDAGHK
jgi:hypothetical protein